MGRDDVGSQRKMNVGVESSIESEVQEGFLSRYRIPRGKRTTYIDPSAS